MKKIIVLFITFILFFSLTRDISGITVYPVDDTNEMLKSTYQIKKRHILPLTAFLGLSTLFFLTDKDLKHNVQDLQSDEMDTVMDIGKYFGEGFFILGLSGLNILAGETVLDKRFTVLGIYILEGFIISGLFVTGVKLIVGRERPYVKNRPHHFKPFNLKTAYKSFPSGHTIEAFTLASVISHFFQNSYLSILMYTLASCTALERVYNNKHWPSDVFVAGVGGILIGKSIIESNKNSSEIDLENENIRLSFKIKEF